MDDEVMQNAIRFLSDLKVQQAPIAKRIEFLKGKGLTDAQIQEALQKSGSNAPVSSPQNNQTYQTSPPPIPARPVEQKTNYFLGLAALSTVAFGIYYGVKQILPHLNFVSGEEIKKTTAEIKKKLEESEKSIEQTKLSTMDVVKAVEAHSEQVGITMAEMSKLLDGYKARDEENKEELRKIQANVDNLIESIPKLIERTKDNQQLMLKEVQAELKSLKALMINRKIGSGLTNGSDTDSPSSNQPFIPSFPGLNFNVKPVLPAWQLAAAQKVKEEEAMASGVTEIVDSEADNLNESVTVEPKPEKLKAEVVEIDSDESTDTAIHLPQ